MEPLLTAPLLALDDVGSGSLSDHERRFTLELLDRRTNALLPTVVTSNWSLQQISDLLDDRISSRLAAFTEVELQGRDRRLPQ
jgi:DNA replication protein DnaC